VSYTRLTKKKVVKLAPTCMWGPAFG
jgi:hypothetical protein